MTDAAHLAAVRASYDSQAREYAAIAVERFAHLHTGHGMLAAFAALIAADGDGPVLDVGCGPGHVSAHLAGLGVQVRGLDLSSAMIALAREHHPGLSFEVGDMSATGLPDASVQGVVSWWSIVHTPPADLPVVLAEFRRVLRPGGHLLVGFHVGDTRERSDDAGPDTYLHPADGITAQLATAGLQVTDQLLSFTGARPKCILLATVC